MFHNIQLPFAIVIILSLFRENAIDLFPFVSTSPDFMIKYY